MRKTGVTLARAAAPAIAALLGLAGTQADAELPAGVKAAFVALGPDGVPTARAIVEGDACPALTVDGRAIPMQLRAAPSVEPQRPTASDPALSKPSAFPVRVCDLALPRHASSAALDGTELPLPSRHIHRIVVIGDTGCRLKAKDNAWQACNDPAQYPFARIAARAAAWKPDLVIHVGDYLYRENPCPAGNAGCAGSPWGYGWDAWDADFFAPGAPLLTAAPWVLVRGNHENCKRAGQGWWRLLDPRPLRPGRDCNDPANDVTGDYSDPYAVPLGRGAQLVVMDLSHAGTDPIPADDPRVGQFRQTASLLAQISRHKRFTFAADHYPFFGVAADTAKDGSITLHPGNTPLQTIFAQEDQAIMPAGVDALLAGHIHVWEQVGFAGQQPSQFVAGFSGTQEDIVPLPPQLPAQETPAPGVPVAHFDSIIASFGYMTLERSGKRSWNATVYDLGGKVLRHCTIAGRTSRCER